MIISCKNAHETVAYAAEELKKYVQMMDASAEVSIEDGDATGAIELGLLEELGLCVDGVEDKFLDDVYDIRIENGVGYIAGSNPRSILFGVYAFLKSAGCMWPRPGKSGEYIPQFDITKHSYTERKQARHRYRSQVIEGALKYEYLMDAIEWMPKVGYNSFFVQFVYPYGFFYRWYNHIGNTVLKPEPMTHEKIEEFIHSAERLVKKCGLILRSMGHGYLFEPYGVRYYGPTDTSGVKYEIPEQYKKYAAMVNGKRDVFKNSINFTQLCFSNPQVRKDCIDYLISFVKERKSDVLQFGLADSTGNFCECEECRKKMPSDWYVILINELQEALDREGLDTRIIFWLYVNTLWAPKYEKFTHPEKLLTGISVSRDYENPLTSIRQKVELPEFVLNNPKKLGGGAISFAFLEQWRGIYDGRFETLTYDSYSIHYADPGLQLLAKRTSQDIKTLTETEKGFSGIQSFQTQRFGFPTALPVALMGEMLVDPSIEYDAYTEKYFSAAFGDSWKKAHAYLEEITTLFNPARLAIKISVVNLDTATGERKVDVSSLVGNPEAQADFKKIAGVVDAFSKVVSENMKLENPCHKQSWELLFYHGTYCKKLADFYLAVSEMDKEKTELAYNDLIDWLSGVENAIGQFFDFFLLKNKRLDVLLGQNKNC